jgi:hypothetical protein
MSLEGDDVSEDPPQALRKMVKTNKRRQLFIIALSYSAFVEKHPEGYRKHKGPFCPSGEASYPKFPHPFTV